MHRTWHPAPGRATFFFGGRSFSWTAPAARDITNGVKQDPADGRVWISPTRLNQFAECPRRWAFHEIDRNRPPKNYGQVVGSGAHHCIEAHFKRGEKPDLATYEGRLAEAMIPHLPPGSRIEFEVIVDVGSPLFKFHGFVDGAVGSDVWDSKFYAASSRKFMKTFETLLSDAQAIVYPFALRAEDGTATFTMHYVIKPKEEYGTPKWEHVGVRWDRASLEAALAELEVRAVRMLWWRQNARLANEVEHRAVTACEGIGIGCEYSGACHLHSEGGLIPPWRITKPKEPNT